MGGYDLHMKIFLDTINPAKKKYDFNFSNIFRPGLISFIWKLTHHQKNFLVKIKKVLQKAGTSRLNQ